MDHTIYKILPNFKDVNGSKCVFWSVTQQPVVSMVTVIPKLLISHPARTLAVFSADIDGLTLKFIWKPKEPITAKKLLELRRQLEDFSFLSLKLWKATLSESV